MKKILSAMCLTVILIFSAKVQATDFNFEVDYGKSKIFSQAEMDFCIEIIKSKLEPSGCTIRNVSYAGDEFRACW